MAVGAYGNATEEDAREETIKCLMFYADFCEEALRFPLSKGKKPKGKFAGAVEHTPIESLMHDGKALPIGYTHYFGDALPGIRYQIFRQGQ